MPINFHVPTASSGGNGDNRIKVADLQDKLVAIRVGEMGTIPTTRGDAFRVTGDTWVLDTVNKEVVPVGNLAYFQTVLSEKLSQIGSGEWMLARIVRPERAFLFVPPSPEEAAVAQELASQLPTWDSLEDF